MHAITTYLHPRFLKMVGRQTQQFQKSTTKEKKLIIKGGKICGERRDKLKRVNTKSPKGENKRNRQKRKVSARVTQSDEWKKLKYKSKCY